ncbi:MAG: sugar transferase [Bacteroidetes bacterium]|nr:MAG: sugar transferase [Bacteroidota bacterium]
MESNVGILKRAPALRGRKDIHIEAVLSVEPGLKEFVANRKVDLLCRKQVNNMPYINRYFEGVNSSLELNETIAGYFETFSARRSRMKINRIPVLREVYFGYEFLTKRVWPKIKGLNRLYFAISSCENRLLSKAEVMGRLVCCGFEIDEVESKNGKTYFLAHKVAEPKFVENSNYGLFFRLTRVGKGRKLFGVRKMRTMHPFSEFLHEYMIEKHGFSASGKIQDDFRLTPWGKFLRKYWIDELPQLINVLTGDMSLVGARPVSESYYKRLPEDLRQLRDQSKPGCIPPYLSLGYEPSLKNVLKAERIYLEERKQKGIRTDFKYAFWALYNIVFKRMRSK